LEHSADAAALPFLFSPGGSNLKCISFGNQIAEQIINENCDLNKIAEKVSSGNEFSTAQIKSMILENMEIARDTYRYYKK
jgi:hypothetical protein